MRQSPRVTRPGVRGKQAWPATAARPARVLRWALVAAVALGAAAFGVVPGVVEPAHAGDGEPAWQLSSPPPQFTAGIRLGFPYLVGGTVRAPLGRTAMVALTGDVTPIGSAVLGRLTAQALFHGGFGNQPYFSVGPAYVWGGKTHEAAAASGVGALALGLGMEYRPPESSMSYYWEAGLDLLLPGGNVYPMPRVAVGVNAYL
ncbi:hypothetical protein U7230_08855 [Carboxydochorda subterranea]|uniref:Outer membrane protein beta-barrel domain-containing protein n=1 Tax=Carboxydichorda subterranea TaxID=3109565 RepID=A0ABZ1BTT4_9FIRM|nr:hypothetical protein [Limnochorda sp. L945t]WRP16211.1 hypothetical protein U7230_08855 [Limnochorda sp. L945t]